MKKLFVSADIEGTAGILSWRETDKNMPDYAYFAEQMTREAAAACEGAHAAGYEDILLRDAHDSARNLMMDKLPEYVRILRGWARHPYCMMFGLDSSFSGVVFTSYHSAGGWDTNPLAHTMSTTLAQITVNGEIASELMLNAMTAALEGVPVFALTGDEGICRWMQRVSPGTAVVPVSRGVGAASLAAPHGSGAPHQGNGARSRYLQKRRLPVPAARPLSCKNHLQRPCTCVLTEFLSGRHDGRGTHIGF